jgi:hypothetical protein
VLKVKKLLIIRINTIEVSIIKRQFSLNLIYLYEIRAEKTQNQNDRQYVRNEESFSLK